MELPNLPPMPPGLKELLLYAIPFGAFAFVGAAVMFLARDLLGKPDADGRNGDGEGLRSRTARRRIGPRNGQRNGGQRGNGRRNGNGNGNGKNGNGYTYAVGNELAIPHLAQPTDGEGTGITTRMENWFSRLLYESGAPYSRDVAFMTEIAGGLLLGGILFVWLENVFMAAFGFFAGVACVVVLYMLARARRQRVMREQLPDLIEHLARGVRAGQTIDQAIHLVGDTSPEPLGIEFRRCAGQLDMGLSVDAAVRALSRRVPIPEMRILASTFIVQRRAGGNLPITLERLAKVIRDRLSYYRQFRAATAGGRMSLLIVASTGPLVATYMMIWQPEFFDKFFQSTLGYIFLGTSITLYVAGLAWIYRILRLKY